MKKLSRRRFLSSGLIGAAGVVGLSNNLFAGSQSKTEINVITRILGKTGLEVPVISMGVMNSDNPALVRAALDKGIKLFDTANGYQNGRNEEMLGNVFKDYPRNSFILATKVQPIGVDRAKGLPTRDTTPEDFLGKFNTSLKRLRMDYVDILYLHKALTPEMASFKPIINIIQQLKKEGRVRFIGISTHNLPAIIDTMVKADIWDVVLTTYNYLNTELIRENAEPPVLGMDNALKKANEAGLGVVAMKTLAGGGYLDKERTKPINTTAAIKWVLSNLNVHTTIPGMTNFDQLDLDIKIMENIALTDKEKNDITLAQSKPGLYCLSCNNCLNACKLKLPIPEIMRTYMYAYGYSNFEMAYTLLNELSIGNNPCKFCEKCNTQCIRRFNIKEKITDISRLINVPLEFIS